MTAPTERQARDALRVVGIASWGLGVEPDRRLAFAGFKLAAGAPDEILRRAPRGDPFDLPAFASPQALGLLDPVEALGWTALAAWVEGGVRPLEVQRWPRFVEYRARLAGRYLSSGPAWIVGDADRLAGSRLDHAAFGELALALAVLRRWVAPTRPWGLRDMIAEHLERVGREATARAVGAKWIPTVDPIPPGYLAAFGTADE